MNKRIKQLMGQTLDEKFAGTWSTMDTQDLTKFAERFAELIVRECADIAQQHNKSPVAAPLAIGYVIREHFGVEE
jgi:hypothetical protein